MTSWQLDANTLGMIDIILNNRWFRNVGERLPAELEDSARFGNWPEVSKWCTSRRCINYKIRAVNKILSAIREESVEIYDNELTPVANTIDDCLGENLRTRLTSSVPSDLQSRDEVIQEIKGTMLWACGEAYWASRLRVAPRRIFLRHYSCFMAGYVACGGCEAYPSTRMIVY